MPTLTLRDVALASGGRARVMTATASTVRAFRVRDRANVRATEYAHHFAARASAPSAATALPPVHLVAPPEVRDALTDLGVHGVVSARSAIRAALDLGPGASPVLDRLLGHARRKGLLATTARDPNGARWTGAVEGPHAWLGPLGRLREVARHLPGALVTNAHFFAITDGEQPTPHGALGDPAGALAAHGVLRSIPLVPRAALVRDHRGWQVATLGIDDVHTRLPGEGDPGAPIERFVRTPEHPRRVHTPAAQGIVDVAIVDRTVVGVHEGGGAPIPPTGVVERYPSPLPPLVVASIVRGAPVTHRLASFPTLVDAVQGGPWLVRGGEVVVDDAVVAAERFVTYETPASPVPSVFPADADRTRAARLGVGVRVDGTLVVVAVEGRSSSDGAVPPEDQGATLVDLAHLLADSGAREAVNLDGGGSVQAFLGSGAVLDGADRRRTGVARFDRLVPTGLAFT